jgi:hypothetical protein
MALFVMRNNKKLYLRLWWRQPISLSPEELLTLFGITRSESISIAILDVAANIRTD